MDKIDTASNQSDESRRNSVNSFDLAITNSTLGDADIEELEALGISAEIIREELEVIKENKDLYGDYSQNEDDADSESSFVGLKIIVNGEEINLAEIEDVDSALEIIQNLDKERDEADSKMKEIDKKLSEKEASLQKLEQKNKKELRELVKAATEAVRNEYSDYAHPDDKKTIENLAKKLGMKTKEEVGIIEGELKDWDDNFVQLKKISGKKTPEGLKNYAINLRKEKIQTDTKFTKAQATINIKNSKIADLEIDLSKAEEKNDEVEDSLNDQKKENYISLSLCDILKVKLGYYIPPKDIEKIISDYKESSLKRIIEELKIKIEEYQKEEIDELKEKIEDLQNDANSDEKKKLEKELQKKEEKINKLKEKLTEKEERLSKIRQQEDDALESKIEASSTKT